MNVKMIIKAIFYECSNVIYFAYQNVWVMQLMESCDDFSNIQTSISSAHLGVKVLMFGKTIIAEQSFLVSLLQFIVPCVTKDVRPSFKLSRQGYKQRYLTLSRLLVPLKDMIKFLFYKIGRHGTVLKFCQTCFILNVKVVGFHPTI